MRHFARASLALALLFTASVAAAQETSADKPHIDVVFCIDCSGSMGPVIETAKQKVWEIVNEVAKAKPTPVLRIGLLGYGNADQTFRSFDLTDDLDEVYKNLMTFRDEGWGTEFVGLSVHKATSEMKWAQGPRTLRVVFVVGNETARQGPPEMDYAKTAAAAAGREVVVNAVYCGDGSGPDIDTWREMATIGRGRFMTIAATGGAIAVASPFDDELAKLGQQLNTTYVAFGREAAVRAENQALQDANAVAVGGTVVAAQRAQAKGSALYFNSSWDLVDASKDKNFKLEEVKEDQLPEELRKMTVEERKAHVEKKAAERAEIQKKIQDLSARRAAFVQDEIAKKGLTDDKAFDENVRKAIVDQAASKGFEFGN